MFISNEENFGHLIDPENFNTSLTHPELYEIFNNVKVCDLKVLIRERESSNDSLGLESSISSSRLSERSSNKRHNRTSKYLFDQSSNFNFIDCFFFSHVRMFIGFHFYLMSSHEILSVC